MKDQLTVPCLLGLEAPIADELRRLGLDNVAAENGRVNFTGGAEAIAKANVNLRVGERVLLELGRFQALSFDELFEGTRALPWEDYIPKDGAFPAAKISSVKSQLFSKSDGQRIVKKAVAVRLGQAYGLEKLPETGDAYPIFIKLLKDKVTLAINTSGEGLNKRGYRAHGNGAPLKETMAAALVKLSRWRPDRFFLDPLCGSGTIVIEAAMIGRRQAPGMHRHFDAEAWPIVGQTAWDQAREEAEDVLSRSPKFRVLGSDIDPAALKQARINAKFAGVTDFTAFQKLPVEQVRTHRRYGVIVTNPPYGVRLSDKADVAKLTREMGQVFRAMPDWSYFILSGYEDFERDFGQKATKNRKLYNSMSKTYFYQYYGPLPPRKGRRAAVAGERETTNEK